MCDVKAATGRRARCGNDAVNGLTGGHFRRRFHRYSHSRCNVRLRNKALINFSESVVGMYVLCMHDPMIAMPNCRSCDSGQCVK